MTVNSEYEHSSWFDNIFHPEILKAMTTSAVPKLRRFHKKNPFDVMAFTGLSGALFASILSGRLQIPMVMVRKANDLHGPGGTKKRVCGFKNFKKYIIIDDLVASGETLKRIHKEVSKFSTAANPELVGVALYYHYNDYTSWPDHRSPMGVAGIPIIQLWK